MIGETAGLRILLVEDDPLMRGALSRTLRQLRHTPIQSGSAEDALDRLSIDLPDMVLTDLHMPTKSGKIFVQTLCAAHPTLPVMVVTGESDRVRLGRALRGLTIRAVLLKPVDSASLAAQLAA